MNFNQSQINTDLKMFRSESREKISVIQEDLKQFLKSIIDLLKSYVNAQKLTILSSTDLERKLLHKFFNFYIKIK